MVEARNVIIAENAMAESYMWGNGTRFIDRPEQVTWDGDRPPADMIAVLLPYEEQDLPDPLSFFGFFAVPDANPAFLDQDEKTLHYSSAPYVDELFHVTEALQGVRYPEQPRYGCTAPFNLIAFWGWQGRYDRVAQNYGQYHIPTKSHTGPNGVGPVASMVWNGAQKLLEPPNVQPLV